MRERIVPTTTAAALLSSLALLSACTTPDLQGKLACDSSLQCPSGYTCDLASGKCVTGSTAPQLTVLTPTDGMVFSGRFSLVFTAVDPAGIDAATVTVTLGSAAAVTAANTTGNTFRADLDSAALGISGDTTVTATFSAKNKQGASGTAAAQVHIDNLGPAVSNLAATPPQVVAGQAITIAFDVGESIKNPPQVALTSPSSTVVYAAYASASSTHYTYSASLPASGPAGVWAVSVRALDDRGNASTAGGASVTLVADPPPVLLSATWAPGVVAPGGTAHLLLSAKTHVQALLLGAPALPANVTTAATVDAAGEAIDLAFTMPARCDGTTGNPSDGVPMLFSFTLRNASGVLSGPYAAPAGSVPFAGVTCAATTVQSVDPTKVTLTKFPASFDGKVRSYVLASSGFVTATGSALGTLTLVARDPSSGALLGSSALAADGSVGLFDLSSPITQANLSVVDALGNATAIGGYNETVELSFAGKSLPGNTNPVQAWDVTTQSALRFAPGSWPGPQELTPTCAGTSTTCYANGADFDQLDVRLPAPPAYATSTPTSTTIGWSQFVSGAQKVMPARGGAAAATSYVYIPTPGGYSGQQVYFVWGGCNQTTASDSDPSSVFTLSADSASLYGPWLQGSVARLATTAAPATPAPGPASAVMLVDNFSNFWVLGGTNCLGNAQSTGVWKLTRTAPTSTPQGYVVQPFVWSDGADTAAGRALINGQTGVATTAGTSFYTGTTYVPAAMLWNKDVCSLFAPDLGQNSTSTGARWLDCNGTGGPQARYNPAIAFNYSSQVWYLYGGTAANGGAALFDLWKGAYVSNKMLWTQVPTNTASGGALTPGRNLGYAYWDNDSQRFTVAAAASAGLGSTPEIWQFDGNGWFQVNDQSPGGLQLPSRLVPGSQNLPAGNTAATWVTDYNGAALIGGLAAGAPLADAWSVSLRGGYSRLLVKAPAQITSLAQASNLQLKLELEGLLYGTAALLWNGAGWDTYGTSRRYYSQGGGSSFYGFLFTLPLSYVQPDGNVYLLLESRQISYQTGPGQPVDLDQLKLHLTFK
jgi:hypothetical protein